MSSNGTIATVQELKEGLEKELANGGVTKKNENNGDTDDDDNNKNTASSKAAGTLIGLDVERCRDILARLDEQTMTIDLLSTTLIGAAVAKLKNHPDLGETAKALIKKWKKVAKVQTDSNETNNGTKPQSKSRQAIASKASAKVSSSSSSSATPSTSIKRQSHPWDELPRQRKTVCEKLYEFLLMARPELIKAGVNEQAVDALLEGPVTDIEAAVFHDFAGKGNKAYADKARSIAFNLKKNRELCVQVLLGQVQPDELTQMTSEQLASAELAKKRAEQAKKVNDSKRLDWEQANEDKINEMCGIKGELLSASLFTCFRCKSTKTTSTQKQTRSADEPMTVFVLCMNCGNRWKC